jgi:predicted aspartyl protease/Tfp pilus assembly protein PilF
MFDAIRIAVNGVAKTMLRLSCLLPGVLLATPTWAANCQLESYGTLPVEVEGGRAITTVKINGSDTRFALDTGAFFSFMSNAAASTLGLKPRDLPVGFRMDGIGGSARVGYAHVKEFGILGTTLKNVDFIVGGSDAGYAMLGANLLDADDLEIDMAHGKFTLFRVEGCDKHGLAYWSEGRDFFMADIESVANKTDRRTFIKVTVNGKEMRALLDSGSYATLLTREAAERAGIDLNAPDVKKSFATHGVGSKLIKTWIAPVDTFSVGTETVQHSQMQVIDGTMGDGRTDMLLGLDYLLAHRMFIANSQRRAFFTYNGGRVFAFATAPSDSDKSGADTAANKHDEALTSAADYALRGEADLSRGEPKAAINDLNEAVRMAPDRADYYVARARALWTDKQSDAALTDLSKSLTLDPKNLEALLLRARLHLMHKDRTSAAADVAAASVLAPAGSPQARLIATLYIQLDQPAAALPLLDDWIRLHVDANDAKLGDALNERCWARALSNQLLDDALHDCRKAIKRDGENPAYLDSLGLVELRLGRYADSIKDYEQAVAHLPRSAWSRYGLGLAKIRSGQADAGNADLVAARAIDPGIEARAGKYGLTATGP